MDNSSRKDLFKRIGALEAEVNRLRALLLGQKASLPGPGPSRLITTDQAVVFLREKFQFECSAFQLAKLRSRGEGPCFQKRGRRVLYSTGDIANWAVSVPPPRRRPGGFHTV